MRLRIVTVGGGESWEAELVQACQHGAAPAEVVQRCFDLGDLLAVAVTGRPQIALVTAGLRWLDREAVTRLADAGLPLVGVAPSGDEPAEIRLRQIGVAGVTMAHDPPELLVATAAAVAAATSKERDGLARSSAPGQPGAGPEPGQAPHVLPVLPLPPATPGAPGGEPVWPPAGAILDQPPPAAPPSPPAAHTPQVPIDPWAPGADPHGAALGRPGDHPGDPRGPERPQPGDHLGDHGGAQRGWPGDRPGDLGGAGVGGLGGPGLPPSPRRDQGGPASSTGPGLGSPPAPPGPGTPSPTGPGSRGPGYEPPLGPGAGPERDTGPDMTPVRSWAGADLAPSPAGGPPEPLLAQVPARAGEGPAPAWAAGGGQPGRIVAVWGPKGAPGRTTIALNLAFEAAPLVGEALLVDADTYGGSVAQSLGFVEDYPGLAWAARLANRGDLDVPKLWQAARRAAPDGPRVLTGLPRAELWTEIRPATWEHLLGQFREAFPLTVLDVGFCLEEDEELLYDQVRFRRNAVARIAVEQADLVVAVARADPVGLHDFIRGWQAFQELGVGTDRVRLVVNQLRSGLFGGDTDEQIRASLTRYLGMAPVAFVPYDRGAMDASLLAARALAEARPSSPARAAIAELARTLLGVPAEPVGAARTRRPFLTGLLGRGGPSGPPPYADLGNGLPAGPAAEPGSPGFGPGGAWTGA